MVQGAVENKLIFTLYLNDHKKWRVFLEWMKMYLNWSTI